MPLNNTMATQAKTNDGMFVDPLDEDTSYSNSSVISYPAAAVASFSQAQDRSPLNFPAPAELTPPPSPPQKSVTASVGGLKFGPGFLTRASSVVSKRQSASSSPTRPPAHARTMSTSYQPQLPASGSTTSLDTQRRRKKSTAFADLFSGSSELVSSFAVSPLKRSETSPNRVLSSNVQLHSSQQLPNQQNTSSSARSTAGSTFSSAAASLFTRSGRSRSPTKWSLHPARTIVEDRSEEEDEILNLDLEAELFRGGDAETLGTGAEALDTLFANAERLFMRMQIAYQQKHAALASARAQQHADMEEWEEARERNEHLKNQLDGLGSKVREQEQTIEELVNELAKEKKLRKRDNDRRWQSLRVVGVEDQEALRGRAHSPDRSSLASTGDGSDSGRIWSRAGSPSSESISTMPDEIEVTPFAPGDFGGGLREENMRLKARVMELEETVEGCLGLVHGV